MRRVVGGVHAGWMTLVALYLSSHYLLISARRACTRRCTRVVYIVSYTTQSFMTRDDCTRTMPDVSSPCPRYEQRSGT